MERVYGMNHCSCLQLTEIKPPSQVTDQISLRSVVFREGGISLWVVRMCYFVVLFVLYCVVFCFNVLFRAIVVLCYVVFCNVMLCCVVLHCYVLFLMC